MPQTQGRRANLPYKAGFLEVFLASGSFRIFLWGQGSLHGEFKSTDNSVFIFSLKEEAGKLFMGLRRSVILI